LWLLAALPHDVLQARKVSQLPSSRTLANAAMVDYIRPVYQVEEQIKGLREESAARGEDLPLEAVLALRQEKSKPILEKFKPGSMICCPAPRPTAHSARRSLHHSPVAKLVRHLDHPEMPVDNNYVERQIKSYATGRKAWLFAYDAAGAQASANLYSLVMSCRANAIEPYAYLNYLFEHLPAASTVAQIEALLPWNLKTILEAQQQSRQRQRPSAA